LQPKPQSLISLSHKVVWSNSFLVDLSQRNKNILKIKLQPSKRKSPWTQRYFKITKMIFLKDSQTSKDLYLTTQILLMYLPPSRTHLKKSMKSLSKLLRRLSKLMRRENNSDLLLQEVLYFTSVS
jgi:hypothetical protein